VIYDYSGLGFRPGDVVVVTGAASGIGRATALAAARSGLVVVCWDLSEKNLGEVSSEIARSGGEATTIVCDVTKAADIDRAWRATAQVGVPRYLVNNAGPPSSSPLSIADGLTQGAASMAAVTEAWLTRFAGEVEATTFTASIAGTFIANTWGNSWYPMDKAAIGAYARQIAVRYGGRPRANIVAPGIILTPRTEALLTTDIGKAMVAKIPLGRIGQPDELAAAICFLLSPAASYINGVTLPVEGGAIWVAE
jgi:NAD(P)-dependent dehydrogenase (short-subunit alcohol dehydrogenase family)